MPAFVSSLFSFSGRLNRAKYLAIGLGVGITYTLLNVTLVGFDRQPGAAAVVPLLGAWFAGVWIQGAAAVRRFHDLDRPGWHYWLMMVPFYGLYLAALLLFVRGTDGPNQYGADPLGPRPGYDDASVYGLHEGQGQAYPDQPTADHPYASQQTHGAHGAHPAHPAHAAHATVQPPAGAEWTCPRCGKDNTAVACMRCGAANVASMGGRRAA